MSEKFVNAIREEANYKLTENGALALRSTMSALVDLFGEIGSLRNREDSEIESLFIKAFNEDKLLATKMAFYARDIRGGLGERHTFRVILRFLANVHPEIAIKNIKNIPLFGRYDDLYVLVRTPAEDAMWAFIREQWEKDLKDMADGKPISLMAKWLKSVDTSSEESRILGKKTARKLGLTEKAYRKTLSSLRRYLDVVERKMSHNQWDQIDYERVPSLALKRYRKAFERRDEERFKEYIEAVAKGEKKINASTLFPYDILEAMGGGYFSLYIIKYDPVLEEQWKNLPNYVDGEYNVVVMADTSGSMVGRPMATSVGLAIYFAERNSGPFKNKFMTFSSVPSWVELKGDTLYEKLKCVPSIIENTNLEAAFLLVLETALKHNLKNEDLPKAIVVISDMEIDGAVVIDNDKDFYTAMAKKFAEHGYDIPNIVFWNVDARHDTFHAKSEYKGVQVFSGQSPAVFKAVLKSINMTPYEAMVQTLSDPRYDCIVI